MGRQQCHHRLQPDRLEVTLGWNAATDGVAVTTYRLYQDNVEISFHDGETLSADVQGLDKTTTYVFRVEAEDAAGNLSFGGPVLTMDLSDKTPPLWPADASLTKTDSTPTTVTLTWSPATDNAMVAGYQIVENDQVVASTPGNETTVTVTGLQPMTSYSFSVVAVTLPEIVLPTRRRSMSQRPITQCRSGQKTPH